MKKRAHRIVLMRQMDVSQRRKRIGVALDWLQRVDRYLNIDDRLGVEPGNRGRAVVIDPTCERAQRTRNAIALRLEVSRPA